MKRQLSILTALMFASAVFVPFADTYAEQDPDYDFEYCQSVDLDTVETYTISFDTDGGTEIAPVTMAENCSIFEAGKIPEDPTKNGYTFFGWFKNSEFFTHLRFDGHEIFDEDTTVYAQFIENSHIINSVDIDVAAPVAGTEVTVTLDTSGGAAFEYQEPIPFAIRTSGTGYEISYAAYVVEGDKWWDEEFEGVFEEGEEYFVKLMLDANYDYRFSNDFTATVNGAPAYAIVGDDGNGQWINVVAKVRAESPIDINIVPAEDTTEDNAAAEAVANLVSEMLATDELPAGISEELAEQIRGAIVDGKDIVIEVSAPEVDDASDDAEKVAASAGEGVSVAAYYNVEILVKIDGEVAGNVTELSSAIQIALPIPADLPAVAEGYTREFGAVRVHDGEATRLAAIVSGDNAIVESDLFSTYALVYQDVLESSEEGSSEEASGVSAPNSGYAYGREGSAGYDSSVVALTAAVLGLVGLAVVKFRR